MCGIAFIINYGTDKINTEFIKQLFLSMNARGGDACGWYFERKEQNMSINRLVKKPVVAHDLWEEFYPTDESGNPKAVEKSVENFRFNGEEKLIIMHTRKKTQGTEYDNHNNMPIYSKNYILAHNGCITAKRLKYKYKGEVDSEELLARLELYKGDFKKSISEISGSLAIIVKPIREKELFIYRHTNPLDLVFFPKNGILVGCSLSEYVPLKKEKKKLLDDLTDSSYKILTLPTDNLFKISTEKLEIEDLDKIYTSVGYDYSNKNRSCYGKGYYDRKEYDLSRTNDSYDRDSFD